MITTIWTWIKRIGLILIAIGGAVLGFVLARRKSPPVKEPEAIKQAEDKIREDQARIAEKDKEIQAKKDDIEKVAEDVREKIKENEDKPVQPGDAGQAADDFLNVIIGSGGKKP